MHTVVLAAGLFVFLAHLLEVFFERTRIPDILLLMILGLLVGPVLHLLNLEDLGKVGDFLAIVTLAVILFESGLGLQLSSLFKSASRAAPFSLISMVSAIACLTVGLKFLMGMDWWTALLGGLIMGGTSSAVVIPMVKALDLGEDTGTILTLESTLTDVFCIIGTVGVAVSLAAGAKPAAAGLLGTAGFSLIAACIVGAAAGFFWSVLLSQVERISGTMFTTMAGALVVYGFSEQMQISGAIATLAFGVTLGNLPRGIVLRLDRGAEAAPIKVKLREVKGVERAVYAESVFLLKAAFFFYLGMTVRPSAFFSMLGVIAFILALVPFVPRYPSVRLFLGPGSTSRRDALLATVLVPRGLAAAVLAQVPVRLFTGAHPLHDAAQDLSEVVAMMVFFSIAIVSLMVFLAERGALSAVGQFAFGSYANGADPGPGSPEPEPQTDHMPGS
jgi:NhaP-type Na+/H+ or K+/H+ antiporter